MTLKKLYHLGKKDGRNYIKEYLGIFVKEINDSNTIIYSAPGKRTNLRLSKGDIVTILEGKGDWIKIDFGQDQPGWINK